MYRKHCLLIKNFNDIPEIEVFLGSTLREKILAGRNFGCSVDLPNLEQFGGSREKVNLAGINFGGFPK